jgi:DNA-binding IscR family transcriptional regulator
VSTRTPSLFDGFLGRLHKAHLVNVHRGTSAGWTLARPPERISLLEVYQAIEQEPLFELHHTPPNQGCVVGKGIQPALKRFYSDAEAAMKQQFAQVSVADVLDEALLPASQAASKGASTYRHWESEQPEPA